MKLTRFCCLLIIFASSAVAASAQTPVDPIARVNTIGDPACDNSTVLCLTNYMPNAFGALHGSAVLSVAFSPTLDVEFSFDDAAHDVNPAARLYELFLRYTGVPALTEFECESDIWAHCAQSDLGGGTIQFRLSGPFTGPPLPCIDNSVVTSCPGFMTALEGATVTNTPDVSPIPEPSSMVLFGTGVILLLAGTMGTRRRRHLRT